MEPTLARAATTSKPRRSRWRAAALGAAGTVAVAGCGGSTAARTSAPSRSTNPQPALSAPATPTTKPEGIAAPDPAATSAVAILNFKFTPAALTIKVGTTVVWTNNDSIAHTVDFATGGINSRVLNQGDQFSHTFTAPGTYDYICSIHPFMHGSVTVIA